MEAAARKLRVAAKNATVRMASIAGAAMRNAARLARGGGSSKLLRGYAFCFNNKPCILSMASDMAIISSDGIWRITFPVSVSISLTTVLPDP